MWRIFVVIFVLISDLKKNPVGCIIFTGVKKGDELWFLPFWGKIFPDLSESEARNVSDALYGTYYPSIDAKGRMSFPNKLRDILGPEFYLCAGHDDNYIAVYSPEEFNVYQGKLNTIPGRQGSIIRRKLLWNANFLTKDASQKKKITSS